MAWAAACGSDAAADAAELSANQSIITSEFEWRTCAAYTRVNPGRTGVDSGLMIRAA